MQFPSVGDSGGRWQYIDLICVRGSWQINRKAKWPGAHAAHAAHASLFFWLPRQPLDHWRVYISQADPLLMSNVESGGGRKPLLQSVGHPWMSCPEPHAWCATKELFSPFVIADSCRNSGNWGLCPCKDASRFKTKMPQSNKELALWWTLMHIKSQVEDH